MKIPDSEHSIQSKIDKHHESLAEPPRPHMGCSQLGHPCDRWLWLSFRWAVQPQFPDRFKVDEFRKFVISTLEQLECAQEPFVAVDPRPRKLEQV